MLSAPRSATAAAACRRRFKPLAATEAGKSELASILSEAKSVFAPQEYDCLGCPVCYPAIAANAFAEMYPNAAARLDLCPTDEPDERKGWPPLPGDYHVLRYQAPVAVCTLNSSERR
jgi:tetrahydromethanopterin S-methyltransferase subunit A